MNYYEARQRKNSEKWDYTCTNDGESWPVGYCAEDGGHETAQEARDCYKRFLLDQRLHLDRQMTNQQNRCVAAGCDRWTSGYAEVDQRIFILCDEHRTREVVESLFTVGTSCSSW
jgi:hypothetical protein